MKKNEPKEETKKNRGSFRGIEIEELNPIEEFEKDFIDKPEPDVIAQYGSSDKLDIKYNEGPCLLKTKKDRFKPYWLVIMGNEIYCYRHQGDG